MISVKFPNKNTSIRKLEKVSLHQLNSMRFPVIDAFPSLGDIDILERWDEKRLVSWIGQLVIRLNCQGSKNCDAVDVGPMSYRTSITNWIDQRDASNARYLPTLTNSIDASCPEKLRIPPNTSHEVRQEEKFYQRIGGDDAAGILTRIRNGEEFSQGISRLPISIPPPLSSQPTKSRAVEFPGTKHRVFSRLVARENGSPIT